MHVFYKEPEAVNHQAQITLSPVSVFQHFIWSFIFFHAHHWLCPGLGEQKCIFSDILHSLADVILAKFSALWFQSKFWTTCTNASQATDSLGSGFHSNSSSSISSQILEPTKRPSLIFGLTFLQSTLTFFNFIMSRCFCPVQLSNTWNITKKTGTCKTKTDLKSVNEICQSTGERIPAAKCQCHLSSSCMESYL